jgi:hypothetical protein
MKAALFPVTMATMLAGLAAAALWGGRDAGVASQPPRPSACRADGPVARVGDLPELSGLALSRSRADILWAHNDSGPAILYALTPAGSVSGRVTVTGVEFDDVEDMAAAPCGQASCLYLADIGDNNASRKSIAVYRVAEPAADATSVPVDETYVAHYPDGARDAEAFFLDAAGRMHIVTKGATGPIALYRFPASPGPSSTLERVGDSLAAGKVEDDAWITGAAASPDGRWVGLRTHDRLGIYAMADLTSGRWREVHSVDLRDLREPQGEGVAIGADGSVYLGSEGGGKDLPGVLVRLQCSFETLEK